MDHPTNQTTSPRPERSHPAVEVQVRIWLPALLVIMMVVIGWMLTHIRR
jgi:uncharacterized membrane protein